MYCEGVKAPERIETPRLVLRKPSQDDAAAIFSRYSSDPEVTKYLAWPRHRSLEATSAFLSASDEEWTHWPAGPYLIESRDDGLLLGSTGLHFKTSAVAVTGYVLARDAWGCGYATEALQAICSVARDLAVGQLIAFCHMDHSASRRVLEKCGFTRASQAPELLEFPNLGAGCRERCLRYCRSFE
jgi:ribosomal-protein-alanine N-acetyltransferase